MIWRNIFWWERISRLSTLCIVHIIRSVCLSPSFPHSLSVKMFREINLQYQMSYIIDFTELIFQNNCAQISAFSTSIMSSLWLLTSLFHHSPTQNKLYGKNLNGKLKTNIRYKQRREKVIMKGHRVWLTAKIGHITSSVSPPMFLQKL